MKCSIDGCDREASGRGWCKFHYEKWRTRGDPEAPPRRRGVAPRPKPICIVEGCADPVSARGMCNSHYARWARHGSPHGGGTFHGEPREYLEKFVLLYDGEDCLIWPYSRGADGYGNINYDGRVCITSRLVCRLTYGDPPDEAYEAAHECGKGHLGCVSPRHLSWKTAGDNQMDRVKHGTSNRGERHPLSVLTLADAIEIRAANDNVPHGEIAKKFGVSREAISAIRRGASWSWLADGEAA